MRIRSLRRSLSLVLLAGLAGCVGTYVEDDTLSFQLCDLDGNIVSPSDEIFKSKVLLVDIWGVWCRPCIVQLPYLNTLYEQYKKDGLEVVGVHFGIAELGTDEERVAGLRKSAENLGLSYPILMGGIARDVEEAIGGLRNFEGFPTTILIGRDGRVKHIFKGFDAKDFETFSAKVRSYL